MIGENKHRKFGEEVEGYAIPVLNEREIRASAGILFLLLFFSLMLVIFENNFVLVKYVIVVFLADFTIRLVFSPWFSPSLIISRWIVSRQVPEYVGASQKKFAWKIGLTVSGLMFLLLVVLNSYSIVTVIGCLICLLFLFFESAFGICLGCIAYGFFYKDAALYCTGESCERHKKEAIQKISVPQVLCLAGFLLVLLLAIFLLHDLFSASPKSLWEIL